MPKSQRLSGEIRKNPYTEGLYSREDMQIAQGVVTDLVVHGVGAFFKRSLRFCQKPLVPKRCAEGVRDLTDAR